MLDFNTRYRPLTSRPFLSDESYREFLPCEALRPYIACYWISSEGGQETAGGSREVLINPDTCMDVIVKINHTRQTITGYLSALFDQPFMVVEKKQKDIVTTFAIRFHFWAAHLFFELDFKEVHNHTLELGVLGADWEALFQPFFYLDDIRQQIDQVEPFLERIYSRDIGLPLKRIANLVRYQGVWREMVLARNFDIHDAVYQFGYTDQAHLLKEFRRFHGTSPGDAIKIAYANR